MAIRPRRRGAGNRASRTSASEHDAHEKFFHEHFKVKGAEAAVACVRTLENVQNVQQGQ